MKLWVLLYFFLFVEMLKYYLKYSQCVNIVYYVLFGWLIIVCTIERTIIETKANFNWRSSRLNCDICLWFLHNLPVKFHLDYNKCCEKVMWIHSRNRHKNTGYTYKYYEIVDRPQEIKAVSFFGFSGLRSK